MFVTVNGVRYQIWLRGGFRDIRSAKRFEDVLRRAFRARYGPKADEGRTIFEMDMLIGMISRSKRVEVSERG